MNWIQVGKLEDIPRQGSPVVKTATGEIALFRSEGDQVFALNNRCPHKGGPLAQGIVHGKRVTCPLHSLRRVGTFVCPPYIKDEVKR